MGGFARVRMRSTLLIAMILEGCASSSGAGSQTPSSPILGTNSVGSRPGAEHALPTDREPAHAESVTAVASPSAGNSQEAQAATRNATQTAGRAIDVEIQEDDCNLLSETYERVWLRESEEKASKSPPTVVSTNPNNEATALRALAVTTAENWRKACTSIAGSSMPRGNLVCASKAKTLARFNDCWDGKTD